MTTARGEQMGSMQIDNLHLVDYPLVAALGQFDEFDRDTRCRPSGMSIEHVGRQSALNLEAIVK
jgi:hypothetical protein